MIHTVLTQRSFDNSWAVGDISEMPSGVILDVSFSLPTYTDVYLTGLAVSEEEGITVYFRDDSSSDDSLVASVTTKITGTPVGFTTTRAGVFGTILFGRIPYELSRIEFDEPIQINPELIAAFTRSTVAPSTLTIYMDGQLSVNSQVLTENMTILGGDDISVEGDMVRRRTDTAVGGVIISMDSGSDQKVYKINNCTPNRSGVISIDIADNGGVVACSVSGNYAVLPEELDSTLAGRADILDSYLAPKRNRQYPYYPADDAYVDVSDSSVLTAVRNTVKNLGGDNAAYILTSVTSSGSTGEYAPIDTLGLLFDSSDSSDSGSDSI